MLWIATHFGKDAKAIVQIRDEDFKETEPSRWVFVAKSVFSHKIVGIVRCGDEKQLRSKDDACSYAPRQGSYIPRDTYTKETYCSL
ncbi:hypothetical protein PHISCL_03849 [Aspergillus sclerotialis]|uniref:Uncharacterized protein n=1 Tax=Aspergillus sclerotialis TaxID=2070753 RepID=A0A3A2ZKU5_9EURO|nr:hypothetical protein PHISCL_03849 [Aspergillus sclerotialis]